MRASRALQSDGVTSTQHGFRTGSFCSGICAPEVAWHALGWQPQFFSEIDPFASAVEAERFPAVPNLGDMTRVDPAAWHGRIDVLVAGTPCQAFSVAGKRGSLDDARGNLTLTFVELVHGIDPRWVVWENVPGVLSTKDNAFGCFLAGLVGEGEPLVCRDGSWPDAGMVAGPRRAAAWRVLDAQYFGLAQRRRRVFVVSCRAGDGVNPGAVLFEPEGVPGDSAPRREAGAGTAAGVAKSLRARSNLANREAADTYVSVTLTASGAPSLDPEMEPLVAHSLRADGFDASEDGTGRGTPLVPVAFNWQSGGDCRINPSDNLANGLQRNQTTSPLSPTLTDPNGTFGDGLPAVAYAFDWQKGNDVGNPRPSTMNVSEDQTPTLGSTRTPAVAFTPVPILEVGKGTTSRGAGPNGCGIGKAGDPMFTLQAGAQHAIGFAQNQRDELRTMDVAGALAAEPGMKQQTYVAQAVAFSTKESGKDASDDVTPPLRAESGDPHMGGRMAVAFVERGRDGGRSIEWQDDVAYSQQARNGGGATDRFNIASGMAVRRLTPRECERLQGFPDDYTRITYRGKPASDGPRYRALGNSMAVPVLGWIGRRITLVEQALRERGAK